MEVKPVLIVAAEDDLPLYEDFHLGDEEVIFVNLWQILGQIQSLEADLILLDAGMNPEIGLGILREIKPRFPGVPIIFLTAKSSEDTAIRAYKQGVRDYLRKPVPFNSLRESIEVFLRFKRNTDEPRSFLLRENDLHGTYIDRDTRAKNLSEMTQKVISFIEQNIREKITLDDMCQVVHVSKYHFSRMFKDEMGMSPMQYVKYRKVQASKELLYERRMSVSSVAYRLGFNDVSSFIRNFKKFEGKTPYASRPGNHQEK